MSGTHVLAVTVPGSTSYPQNRDHATTSGQFSIRVNPQVEVGKTALSARATPAGVMACSELIESHDGRVKRRVPGRRRAVDDFVTPERSCEPSTADAASQRSAAGAVVTLYENGPLILRGQFALTAQDGELIPPGRRAVALCRCGASTLKPFCDGSHARIRFRAPGRAQGGRTVAEHPGGGGGAGQPLVPIADAAAESAAQGEPAAD